MTKYLIISALAEHRPGIVNELTRTILDSGCRITDSRMTILGAELAITMLIHGSWNTLAKLEVQLKRLEQTLGMVVVTKRTRDRERQGDFLPYTVEAIAVDQPGIVHSLVNFFSHRSINIEELFARSYSAPHTETPMFSVNMVIGVPASTHIAMLREEFVDFCDQLNLDAVLEPVRG